MAQEDKELLFKDLCSRLPYGIKAKIIPLPSNEYVKHLHFNAKVTKIDIDYIEDTWSAYSIEAAESSAKLTILSKAK